jgi:flagellar basal body-associated protein FliL
LGCPDVRPGTPLANIGNMADVQPSPAPKNASVSAPETVLKSEKKNKSKSKKTTVWVAAGLALALGAAGIFGWLGRQGSTSTAEGAAESTFPLETFVVNLTGSGQRAYLRVGITLGLAHPLANRNQADAVPIALVRDTILSVLATAQPEKLLGLEGKRQLKEELVKALQERVPQMAVENVYFTEFLVQM